MCVHELYTPCAGMEMRIVDVGDENGISASEEVRALNVELAALRRYTQSLHAALYGGAEAFSPHILEDHPLFDANSDGPKSFQQLHSRDNGQSPGDIAVQEWRQHIEVAPDADLVRSVPHVNDVLTSQAFHFHSAPCQCHLSPLSLWF